MSGNRGSEVEGRSGAPTPNEGAREPSGPAAISLEALVRLPTLLGAELSWQGDEVAFYSDQTGRNELFVQTVGRDDARQVSHGEAPPSVKAGPIWDRAGSALVFAKDAEGDEKYDLYRLAVASGEVSRLTRLAADMRACEFSPDDRWILFAANAAGRRGKAQLNAWRVAAEGGAAEQLTDFDAPVGYSGALTFGPDGRTIAFSANESSDLRNADVYVCTSDGGDPRRVFRSAEGARDSVSAWHPDGRRLLLDSDSSGVTRPLLLDLESEEVRAYGPGTGDEYAHDFSPDGSRILTLRLDGVQMAPGVYDLASGQVQAWAVDEGITRPLGFTPDGGGLVCAHTSSVHRPELVLLRVGAPAVVLRAAEYGTVDSRRLVSCTTIRYPSFDGREIEALLYSPRSIPDGARLPAIVEVHGGPTAQFSNGFNPLAQYLVSRGMVLLQPNVRGSTGYGPEFRDLSRYDWGGGDLEDVVRGTEYLAGLPCVDPKRIGIWGGSYGGFMTYLATVRRPELWKAACAWVGISDLERLYDESRDHYQYYFREQMGDPKTRRDLWRERSAIHSAERLLARLLIVHGVNDPRCPIDQARLFRDRLVELGRKEGTDFEYVELAEEGHGSSDVEQRLRSYRIVSEFFGRAL